MAQALRLICNILFTILFGFILIRLLFSIAGSGAGTVCFLLLFLLITVLILPRLLRRFHSTHHEHGFSCKRAWILVQIPGILIMAAAFLNNRMEPAWDWGQTVNIAIQYAINGYTSFPIYVAIYSNNRFWITALVFFFKIIECIRPSSGATALSLSLWLLNCMLTIASVNLIYLTAKSLFSERQAFFTGALAAFYLPIFLYAQIYYTDTPAMFLCALLLYLYSRMRLTSGKQKTVLLILFGATAAIAYRTKVLVFIFVLAVLIEEFLRILTKGSLSEPGSTKKLSPPKVKPFLLNTAAVFFSFALAFGGTGYLSEKTLDISDELIEEYELPLTHWIMMGLSEGGGYNGEDYAFTTGISGYGEKTEATISVIRERLEAFGGTGLLKHILSTKLCRTWCTPMLNADGYIEGSALEGNSLFRDLFAQSGSLSAPAHLFVSAYYFMLMLGVFVSGLSSVIGHRPSSADRRSILHKKNTHSQKEQIIQRNSIIFICRTSLIGFFIFECIWECNSRYLLCLIPALMLVAGDGLGRICQTCS